MRIRRLSIAGLVVVCLLAVAGSASDRDTVEQLIDAHDQAWLDNDPEGVGAFFAEEGVFIDLTGAATVGREAIVRYAETHVELISESRITGPVEELGYGHYIYPGHLVVTAIRSGTYTGLVAITVEDGLFLRYDLSQLTPAESS